MWNKSSTTGTTDADTNANATSRDEAAVREIRAKLEALSEGDASAKAAASSPNMDWRDPAEVKIYMDNLQTEYSFQCFSERLPDGCHRLASFLETVRNNYTEATALYKKTCDEMNHPRSCVVYAKNALLGRGTRQNMLDACKYSVVSCDHNLPEGCLNAGVCLEQGVGGLPVDVPEAVRFYSKACDAQHPIACVKLFNIYLRGSGGVARDPARAFEYTKRACSYRDAIGCVNASVMLRKGDGIPQDIPLCEKYRDEAQRLRDEVSSTRAHPSVVFGEQHK